ncbi:hypothetical protein GCM10011316_25950 [Roseibium aquae]|uniref:Uncharacterized protein n=1 Tax=Roseibium aquae TaxID=1323746 RepID=A0A916TLV7_9HYPH|nr:hypothetical protein [Roseibium aquae]GGB52718.1 hypothetical protein GCM10011316_25950 [Roseibium aquae]
MSQVTLAIRSGEQLPSAKTACYDEAVQSLGLEAWLEAAENTVLVRLKNRRVTAGLARHYPPLSLPERLQRFNELFRLWNSGCGYAIDERLFADILARRRAKA